MILMKLYEKWLENKELKCMSKNEYAKVVHRFEWGLRHLDIEAKPGKELERLIEYNIKNIQESAQYFVPRKLSNDDYALHNGELTFNSTVKSHDPYNDVVHCNYFPSDRKDKVVIVVPHWNSTGSKYDKMCKLMKMFNFSSIRISLPFHDKRGGPELFRDGILRSTLMVSANIGLTLMSMRQIVQDIISVVTWLEFQGYKKIGIMGTSIGSCAAFIAAAHDQRLSGVFTNLMSSYFGDVVWEGISTMHIRRSVDPYLTLDDLRNIWLLNSPIAYVEKIGQYNPGLKQFIVAGRYDKTFPFHLTELLFNAYDEKGIKYRRAVLPCGHYTVGKSVFKYIDAYYVLHFFKDILGKTS